jgi:FAD/FMN-containing dehydrogenase
MTSAFENALAALSQALPPERVLSGEAAGARHHCDWTHRNPCMPGAVVRPRTTVEVAAALRACHDAGQPVVVQGGLTGLSGGATPRLGEIALSLELLNGIESIDPLAATMQVWAGTPLAVVQATALEHGLQFSLDLGARGSCTIGGNLSTNAGGNRVIRYGMARDLVLGVEAVLADGTVVSQLNSMMKNNAGYDLKQLFIGTEGTLGVITRAVLKLHPAPRERLTAFVSVDGFDQLCRTMRESRASLGGQLGSFETMWSDYYEFALTKLGITSRPFSEPHSHYALIEMEALSPADDAPRFEALLAHLLEAGLVSDAVLANSTDEALRLWRPRDAAGELVGGFVHSASYDVSLPLGEMPDYLRRVHARTPAVLGGGGLLVFGHLGDGNLHLVTDLGDAEAAALDEIVYGELAGIGSVSAEHGIGQLKRGWLGSSRSSAEIDLMRLLKRSLDPRDILNPGRIL